MLHTGNWEYLFGILYFISAAPNPFLDTIIRVTKYNHIVHISAKFTQKLCVQRVQFCCFFANKFFI